MEKFVIYHSYTNRNGKAFFNFMAASDEPGYYDCDKCPLHICYMTRQEAETLAKLWKQKSPEHNFEPMTVEDALAMFIEYAQKRIDNMPKCADTTELEHRLEADIKRAPNAPIPVI